MSLSLMCCFVCFVVLWFVVWQLVMESLRTFHADPELPDFASRAVHLLAMRPSNKELFRRIGVKNMIERATNARFTDEGLQLRARQALLAVGDWGALEEF